MNKKNIITLAFVSVLALSLANCAKNEDEGTASRGGVTDVGSTEVTAAPLLGKWTKESNDSGEGDAGSCYNASGTQFTLQNGKAEYKVASKGTIEYKSDGTYLSCDEYSEEVTYTAGTDGTNNVYQNCVKEYRTNYYCKSGTYAVESGALVITDTNNGSSYDTDRTDVKTSSQAAAMTALTSGSTPIEYQRRVYKHNVLLSGDANKLALDGVKGGNTADLTGTWGSLTSPLETVYRHDGTAWLKASEEFFTFTHNAGGTFGNSKSMSKYWYEKEQGDDMNGDTDYTDWFSTPYYYNKTSSSYSVTEVVNDGDRTGYSWSYSNGTYTVNHTSFAKPYSKPVTIFGSVGFDYTDNVYTKQ